MGIKGQVECGIRRSEALFNLLKVTKGLKSCEIGNVRASRRGENYYPAGSPSLLGLNTSSASLQHFKNLRCNG